MKETGKISVIMGIYNCAETLAESIESILQQTYQNWELIMCDDSSSDKTFQIAMLFKNRYPERIIVLQNEVNMGLNYTLNKCFACATGEYIGRMDGDDISTASRFSELHTFLENNKEFDIVSSEMIHFDNSSEWGVSKLKPFPTKYDFVNGTPFPHAASLFTRKAFEAVNGYSVSERLLRVEDYDLWSKMYAKGFRGANLLKPLYRVRDDRNAYNRRKFRYRINESYAMFLTFKRLKLPLSMIFFAVKPLLVGMLPSFVYHKFHKLRLQKKS